MHALIIEDEPLIAMGIEDALRERGYTSFSFAESVEEAVDSARNRCPDLITSDVMLKPGNGINAIETICGRSPLPVVFITSSVAEVQERLPGYVVIRKPYSSAELSSAIDRVVSRQCDFSG